MVDMNFLTTANNLPFLVAGCLVIGILILELMSMMIGHSMMLSGHDISGHEINVAADLDGNGIPDYLEGGHVDMMSWLNPAGVPFMVFLVLFSGMFAILGYGGQWTYMRAVGHLAPLLVSVPVTMALTLPLCRITTRELAKIMPRDITTAINVDSLAGQVGVVNVGPITSVSSGVARFTDSYGTDHNLIVFSESDIKIDLGSSVLLVGPHRDKTFASIVRPIL